MPHTPGPWEVVNDGTKRRRIRHPIDGEIAICREDYANLIAAAPMLLEAAKQAVQLLQFGYVFEDLRAAIAAAEGGEA